MKYLYGKLGIIISLLTFEMINRLIDSSGFIEFA